MKKALLKVGYSCNNNCIFCHSRPFRSFPDLTTKEIKKRIGLAKSLGAEMVVFSGGEPTLRGDIVELVRFAHARSLRTGFVTNGRRFVYPDFAAELAALGFSFAYVSFHSHLRQVHEISARTDSFLQTLRALENLARLGVEVAVNMAVTRHNIDDLQAAVDILAALRPGKIKFSVLEPKGAVLDDSTICPPLSASADAIAGVIRYGRSKHPGIRFGCEGLTPCLLEDFDISNDDLITNGFFLFQEAFEGEASAPDYKNRTKPSLCFDCARMDRCPGIFRGYLSMEPPPPLKPEVRPLANAFVFVKKGKLLPIPENPRACPMRGAGDRRIYLAQGRLMRAYETPTVDFTGADIEELLRLGQIYLTSNINHKGLDCGRDLVKLRAAPLCGGCGRKDSCSRLYAPSDEKVFKPLESALEGIVRRLGGEVLEVGCGAVRFRGIIEARVRANKMRYTGVDPELPSLRVPRGMRLLRAGIEDFNAPDASFDHILILRSYNHIRSLSAAFPRIHRMLRPGGRLTVVDGTAYGIVLSRKPEPAAPGEFQHFRNHTSKQAKTMLEAFGFVVVREVPVHPAGCNEWLLVLRKK